ncbi:MAG: sugar ABC transporter permease [Ruminococcaceae bacterium]|nr:sugar ABC transporter permease [Oscillospiraceae bacterium]
MKRSGLETKNRRAAFLFTVPFLIGFVFFFFIPIFRSIIMSVSKVTLENGIQYDFIGFENYQYLFNKDPSFIPNLGNTIIGILSELFLIIIFSFFIANILTQNFKGRLLARAIFFLPVIIASGVIMGYITGDANSQEIMQSATKTGSQFQATVMQNILLNANMSSDIVNIIISTLNNIFEIPWKSGIQILIFMSGLQAISPSIKEAAKVEGATGWEFFWKITFPLLMPVLELNIIYSIIDGFTDLSNPIVKQIFEYSSKLDYSYSSTIAWTYFAIIFVIIVAVYLSIRKKSDIYNR